MVRKSNSDFNFGGLFGGLIGFAIASLIWTLPLPFAKNWIDQYQSLLTGILALFVGAASIYALNIQIQQAETFKQDELERERRSVRPLLSFLLVKILDYSQSCFVQLRQIESQIVASGQQEFSLPVKIDFPILPDETFDSLHLNLKFGSISAISVISKLLIKLQIQNSRYRNLIQPEPHQNSDSLLNLHVYMADVLEVSTLCSRLFPYARNELNEVETAIEWGHLFQAGTLAVDFASQDPFVLYIINRYRDLP
jgi:hypothetical protein